MRLILLSGGSGKRLWPLSNDSRSKQFLKVLENENKEYCSMVQRVYSQLNKADLSNSTIIATSKSQVEMLQNQLGDNIPIIVEPARRDTFAAIALAATYLYSMEESNPEEVIGVLPVDPYVDDRFFDRISELENLLTKTEADLALIGVNPTFPSSKYGYIIPKDNEEKNINDYIDVDHFIEKPSEIEALKLIQKKALWNCGIFAFKIKYILNILESKKLPINYNELLSRFSEIPKNSFDYEVVEKAERIVALTYDGYWKDLGTWNTLTEEMSTNIIGKGKISEDCKDVHIVNELDIPLVVLGASNLIVAVSPDGILVSDKDTSPKIKEYTSEFNERPMYEERRWGWYRILDYTKTENDKEVITKRIGLNAGMNLSYQYHDFRSEVWTIIKGTGQCIVNGVLMNVDEGDVIKINSGDKHSIKAFSDIELIEVQTGTQIIEEDIVRICFDWEDINKSINR
ncbi:mannose-1-phosphate guanylyltransferase [Cytobacillus oceanisediminis]|uniref:sugar phosphate nucleotidyltransferase n=1 Tax=Cytobacillus oceanisediminis TaxID=665099 RepID=UPI001CCB0C52|nr:sugar phosphate nucleotidyltransferase [Cytobacillus oceanisediminis]MBZ9536855.1 mannose-1-phosphate guanylyltransferase [Cytobacillus oceanisediminis]